MNGAESLVRTLLANGVDTCFANPGTSEMHFVAALDRIAGMRCVLGLFEGVVTGAADGYARMAGKPAATLLHCGPGLANGLANLHNASRGNVPILNIVGDQATYQKPLAPPLATDTEGWARPVSVWMRTSQNAGDVGADASAAVQAAMTAPGGIATLILPSDASWNEGGRVAAPLPAILAPTVDDATIAAIAGQLRNGRAAALLLDGRALGVEGLALAERIHAATGARILHPNFVTRIARGAGRLAVERIPYVVDQAVALLAGIEALILVGAKPPVSFFAYPGKPSTPLPPDCRIETLARPDEDLVDALARLCDALGAPSVVAVRAALPEIAKGPVSSASFAQTLAAILPEGAVVVDESISFGLAFMEHTKAAAPHDWLMLNGGAIGFGLPLATGAAIGAPGRRVVNLEGDGSALYTIQALWTQAHENLDVTTVILNNGGYAILEVEIAGVGASPGHTALDMMRIEKPAIDWMAIAKGFSIEAARTSSLEGFADLFTTANRRKGPFLIEMVVG